MKKRYEITNHSDEDILGRIYHFRGIKVMLDRDLAELYGVETKALKQAVKRNIERFPYDFMFEMSNEEFQNWRSQFVTSNSDKMGLRYKPFCFTEHGITMLSCILNSHRAIQVNIRIIRVFCKMRELVLTHRDIIQKLEELESKVDSSDEQIQLIFEYLKKLITSDPKPRKRVGYKISGAPDELAEPKPGRLKRLQNKK
ncbi:MAG: ORF6N domain-containing protein [Bacteroidota bacterium]